MNRVEIFMTKEKENDATSRMLSTSHVNLHLPSIRHILHNLDKHVYK